MHFQKISAILALSATALALPRPGRLMPRDFVSNGVLYVETTVIEYVTVTETPASGATSVAAAPDTDSSAVIASVSATPAAAAASSGDILSDLLPSSTAAAAPAAVTTSKPAAKASPSAKAPAAAAPPPPAAASSSSPAAAAVPTAAQNAAAGSISAAQVQQVAPSSNSCSGAAYPDECITAAQAAPAIALSYTKYGINSKAAQAAVLALMVYESGSFQYNAKHFPPTPGQGTRNMMSPNFVSEYATDLYGAAKVAAAGSPDAVLALVQNLNDSCGSGAWFLATKCPNVLSQFATDPAGAWTAYLGPGCIGTTDTGARDQVFTAAKAALGVS